MKQNPKHKRQIHAARKPSLYAVELDKAINDLVNAKISVDQLSPTFPIAGIWYEQLHELQTEMEHVLDGWNELTDPRPERETT